MAGRIAPPGAENQHRPKIRHNMFHTVFTTWPYARGMFQGPIQAADYAGSNESPILRQLRWTDLVARLAVTRDMRSAPAETHEERLASFTAFHRENAGEGQQPVNRDALARGKLSRLNTPDAANNAGNGDRETQ